MEEVFNISLKEERKPRKLSVRVTYLLAEIQI
jgi:hypothetical protein